MLDRDTCKTHLRKLSGIPFFNTVSDEAFSSWVTVLAKQAEDIQHAIRAVDMLLSSRQLPQAPDDIRDAVNATRNHEKVAALYPGGCCGQEVEGRTFLQFNSATERHDMQKYLWPAQCVRGWVHWTIWVPVVPGRIDDDGNPLRQPYHYAGRCKCQPGGQI